MNKAEAEKRIAEIRKKLANYHDHKNDVYAYVPMEIEQIRDLYLDSPKDIEFLLHYIRYIDILFNKAARATGSRLIAAKVVESIDSL